MSKEEKNKKVSDVAQREEDILAFWQENDIFAKTEKKDAPKGEFVFYDGPPFATGLPHYGHILPGTIKDAIPRYKTMRGYRVRRTWGWDCHGLPIENIIEKQLGLKTKKDIEEIGVGVFNETARNEVLRYEDYWRTFVPRMGRFVHMHDDYKTMDASYTQSVWWAFSELNRKGLVSEGFKAMHLCPRCGTTLSNFEVAQGYEDIKDFSVTIKLALKDEKNTYLLAWTTTPWTLPGNVAAAVHKDELYVSAELENGDIVIVGKERAKDVLQDIPHQIVREFKGKELVGKSYTPPFDYFVDENIEHKENAWKVWHADYVTQEDGTGLVHIAPAFGAEDMELAGEHDIPLIHHVGTDGKFVEAVTDFKGMLVKPKDDKEAGVSHMDADVEIIKKLAYNGVLFAKEKIEHSYPHCWRCGTPLLNYAASSWFVNAPRIKKELLLENSKVGWVPQDIRDGRFGKWLEGVRDWAISRSRYWGAPIPVWKTEDGDNIIIGSYEEMKTYVPHPNNTYHITRHGEAEHNTKELLNAALDVENGLTEKGKKLARKAAKELKGANIDLIYHSPLQRTRETAEIIREELGLEKSQMSMDGRLKEIEFGVFEGKPVSEYLAQYKTGVDRLRTKPEGGESWNDVRTRVGDFLFSVDREHANKHILIVSHNGVLQMLQAAAEGFDQETTGEKVHNDVMDLTYGEVRELPFRPYPHNQTYELDFHRPYIDEFELVKDGKRLTRVPDVFDCWFESGSMPYAQHGYIGDALPEFDPKRGKGYPADFIAEGLDQTRGWFYSLIVLGTALFGTSPYKNVVVNGLVQAEDGKKMSKSLKNYPDPMDVADAYGVDALRYYLLSSPIVRGEDLHFSEKGVQEVMRKNIGRLHNVLSFYNLYKDELPHKSSDRHTHVLDAWIIARLNQTRSLVTKGMEQYELDRATRPIGDFIDDLSTWYLRRSRDRFKGQDTKDKKAALETTRYVLLEISKTMAPFMPFYAEFLYKEITQNAKEESVHLEDWNEGEPHNEALLEEMKTVRSFISLGLEARDAANIKVRQPLQRVIVPAFSSDDLDGMTAIIQDELNVKEVSFAEKDSDVEIDTNITPELQREGEYRDLLRYVQSLRKEAGLEPSDRVSMHVHTDAFGKTLIETFTRELTETAGLSDISFEAVEENEGITIGENTFRVRLVK